MEYQVFGLQSGDRDRVPLDHFADAADEDLGRVGMYRVARGDPVPEHLGRRRVPQSVIGHNGGYPGVLSGRQNCPRIQRIGAFGSNGRNRQPGWASSVGERRGIDVRSTDGPSSPAYVERTTGSRRKSPAVHRSAASATATSRART
jgi:hypothetical protein